MDVYQRVRTLIIHSQLAPGSRINETEIAQRLGVSRTPVRSALQRLRFEGFIHRNRPGEPTRLTVAPLTRRDAEELFEIVGALEGVAAYRTARLPSKERGRALAKMSEVNTALRDLESAGAPSPGSFYDLDSSFHQACIDAGAGSRLKHLHDAVKPQTERYVRMYVSALGAMVGTSVEEHELILSAIRARAADFAREAMRENWTNAAQRLARIIDTVGERGAW